MNAIKGQLKQWRKLCSNCSTDDIQKIQKPVCLLHNKKVTELKESDLMPNEHVHFHTYYISIKGSL